VKVIFEMEKRKRKRGGERERERERVRERERERVRERETERERDLLIHDHSMVRQTLFARKRLLTFTNVEESKRGARTIFCILLPFIRLFDCSSHITFSKKQKS